MGFSGMLFPEADPRERKKEGGKGRQRHLQTSKVLKNDLKVEKAL